MLTLRRVSVRSRQSRKYGYARPLPGWSQSFGDHLHRGGDGEYGIELSESLVSFFSPLVETALSLVSSHHVPRLKEYHVINLPIPNPAQPLHLPLNPSILPHSIHHSLTSPPFPQK